MIEKKNLVQNHQLKNKKFAVPFPLISFLVTGVFLLILFAIFGYTPFGKYTVLTSDLMAQYAPDLVAYKNKLLAGGNLQYSSLISLGKNTFGIFAYYLSSPLNFLTFLFPTERISEAILLLISVKLSLAAATMTLFLRGRYRTNSRYSIIFGMAYAFCSYAIVFMMNIMWIDGFFLLPLLVLFVEQLMEDGRRWKRLVFVLVLLFVSGFYIAYMVGIFSFLYLIFRLIEQKRFSGDSLQLSWKLTGKYIGIAILSTAISAALLIPAGLDILRNPDFYNQKSEFKANFTFLTFLDQLPAGSFDSLANNKPLIYCGICALLLCILFFLNTAIPFRRKVVIGVAFTGLLLSFSASALNLMWHLFDNPNWFQYRYSFLFSFVLLSVAFESILNIRALKGRSFIVTGLLFLLLLFLVQGFGDLETEGSRFFVNLLMGIALLVCLYAITDISFPESIANLKRLVPGFLVFLICVEAVLVNPLYLRPKVVGGEQVQKVFYNGIIQGMDLVDKAEADAQKDGIDYFRMETTDLGDGIDPISAPLLLHYNGTSTFNSSANKSLNRFLKQFGYCTNYNYFAASHNNASIVADSLFGIRYVFYDGEIKFGYEQISESKDESMILLKNRSALPILYAVRPEAADFDLFYLEKNPQDKDPFAFQDTYLQAAFGPDAFSEPVYTKIPLAEPVVFNAIKAEAQGLSEDKDESSTGDTEGSESIEQKPWDDDLLGEEPIWDASVYDSTYYRLNKDIPMKISYTFTVPDANPIYFSIVSAWRPSDASIYIDGEPYSSISASFYTSIIGIGEREPGDVVTIEIRSTQDSLPFIETLVYSCDTKKFEKQIEAADPAAPVTFERVEDGYVSATIDAVEDTLIVTTIPDENGWTLMIDGKQTPVTSYHGAFISFPVTQGKHTVELSFHTPGLTLGVAVSSISLAVFSALVGIEFLKRKRNA